MAAPMRRYPVWQRVPLEAVVLLLGVIVAGWLPLRPLDEWAGTRALLAVSSPEPPTSAAYVSLSVDSLEGGGCSRQLDRLLRQANARGALLIPPAQELCRIGARDGAIPLRVLPASSLRLDAKGRVVGFAASPGLAALGLGDAQWVSPRGVIAVPAMRFDDLVSGALPVRALHDRIAVVGVDAPIAASGQPALGARVAAAVGAALDDGPRQLLGRWTAAFAVLLLGLAMAGVHARRGTLALFATFVLGLASLFALQVGYLALGGAQLLPLFSILTGSVCVLAALVVPAALAARRSVARASVLIERAALLRAQSVHTIPDAEFWVRVATLSGQAHPSDAVIVAELPPHRWHLKFWSNGQMGENMISERRRDIRRRPYCDDNGVPAISVIRNYLVMKDVPVLVVPLIAFGDVEGYVFLCGAQAEEAYRSKPELADRLSQDVGLLLRRRRMGSLQEADWRRTAGAILHRSEDRASHLVEGAQIALDDLRLLELLLQEAPVGMLYADAFADVRIVGREAQRWLLGLGVQVASRGDDAPLSPGALPLSRIIGAFSGDRVPPTVAAVVDNDDGLRMRSLVERPEAPAQLIELSIRALTKEADGARAVVGYVASVVEVPLARSERPGTRSAAVPIERRGDAISVLPAASLVADVIDATARRVGKALRLEPVRTGAHVLAHRRVLAEALQAFLVDAMGRSGGGAGPVIAVSERRHRVEIAIMDTHLGVPVAALRRTLRAPTASPDGLEAFGRLVAAVEDSHGHVAVRAGEGWGVTLSLSLVRARSTVERQTSAGDVVDLSDFAKRANEER